MTIVDALKDRYNYECAISNGSKRLYYDVYAEEWVVIERVYRHKNITELYRGNSEEQAAKALTGEI
jgi:hypothetical protein